MTATSKVEAAVDDLVGTPVKEKTAKPAANKAAKPAANKAAKAKPAPAAAAAPAKAATPKKPAAAPAAKAGKPAAPAPKKAAATPAAKPGKPAATPAKVGAKVPTKKAAPVAKAGRGEGKFYFAPADREALGKQIKQHLRTPITTSEYGAKHNIPTWKVRLAAVTAGLKLQKVGASLTMHPAK